MPRLLLNPNDALCPDYEADIYEAARDPFVIDGITLDQAANILATVWVANNAVDRVLWQEQADADALASEERQRDTKDARILAEEDAAQEKAEQRRDEVKKNKSKYTPIPARPVPKRPPVIASHYASRKMDKGEYVPIWYYTNRGLEDALRSYDTADDDAMTILKNDDGSTSLIPTASAKDSKRLVNNQDLGWEDFCVAAPRMIEAMGRADWPQPRIRMMAAFWSNLQTHPYRSSPNALDLKTLLVYQAEQWCLWHFTITTPNCGYDLSELNEELLCETKERLHWVERNCRDRLFELPVRFSLSIFFALLLTPLLHFPPPSPPLYPPAPLLHACCFPMTYRRPTLPHLCLPHACRTWTVCPHRPLPEPVTHMTDPTCIEGHTLPMTGLQPGTVQLHPDPINPLLQSPTVPALTRIFRPAQAERSIPPVQSAWAATSTMCANAAPTPHGTAFTRQSPNASGASCSAETAVLPFVSTGNSPVVATAAATTAATSALAVPNRLTVLRNALKYRKLEALTPYRPDAWEHFLLAAGLHDSYPHIPTGLRQGFRINLPPIAHTQSPPNRSSIDTHLAEFTAITMDEFTKGRYIGPFSRAETESLIGPFQSSPFSIIPKPGKPGKFHIIQNYSFPHKTSTLFPNPSVNSVIDSSDFPTTWGTFTTVSLLLHRLPPGSQIATCDVAEAYRTIPLHHSQWPAAVARISDDCFGIDTSTCFGVRLSAGIYGDVRNAGTDILRFHGIGLITAWVDDHFFIRILRQHIHEYNKKRE